MTDRWLSAERRRPFDTAAGPLVRFAAHDGGGWFRLTVASFSLDGWCDATLLSEVLADYTGRLRGAPPDLPTPDVEYRDFVAAERAAIGSPRCQEFWRGELAGARPAPVPRWSRTRPSDPAGRRHQVPLDDRLTALLPDRAAQLGVGLKHVLLGAHLGVLGGLTAAADIVTGLQVNGRPERAGADRTIGMFNNILPLRARVRGGSWAELIRWASQAEARLAPHRRFPLVELNRRYQAARLFDTLFVFTHFHAYQRLSGPAGVAVSGLYAPDQTYVPLTAHANVDAWSGELGCSGVRPARVRAGPGREIGERYAAALVRHRRASGPVPLDLPGRRQPAGAGQRTRRPPRRTAGGRRDAELDRLCPAERPVRGRRRRCWPATAVRRRDPRGGGSGADGTR